MGAASSPGRALLWALWAFADLSTDAPVVFPSQALLGAMTGAGTRMVRKTLADLERLGAVTVHRAGPRSNRYELHRAPLDGWLDLKDRAGEITAKDRNPEFHSRPEPPVPLKKTGTTSSGLDRNPEFHSRPEPPVPTNHQGTTMEPPDHREGVEQFALIPPEAEPDTVRELWELQERYRREVNPKSKGLKLSPERRRRVAARLKAHGEGACRHVLEVRRAESLANPESARWLNGVTNWRPDPFELALSMDPETASKPRVRKLHTPHREDRQAWNIKTTKTGDGS